MLLPPFSLSLILPLSLPFHYVTLSFKKSNLGECQIKINGHGGRNQDGGIEGRALTPSCENTRITTSCSTIINRKTLELTKKDTPHPKTKEKPQ